MQNDMKRELIAGTLLFGGGIWGLAIVLKFINNLMGAINGDAEFLLSNIFEIKLLIQLAICIVLGIIGGIIADMPFPHKEESK